MSKYNYHDFLAYMGVGGAHPGGMALTKGLLNKEQLDHNSRVLDAGCGTGQTAAYIAKTYGCHVTAIDRHPLMIQKAKQRFTAENVNVDITEGNIEKMPFPDASFDFVLAESVTVFTDISRTISEYSRILRQGGILIDLEMTVIPPPSSKMIAEFQQFYGIRHIPSEKEWLTQCKLAGLSHVEILRSERVLQSLYKSVSQTEHEGPPELTISGPGDPAIYQIWDEHQLLTEKYADQLKYIVFKACK